MTQPSGPILSLPAPFSDSRGEIQTLVSGGFHSLQVITSCQGSVRANHYHLNDSHYMYVISGSFKYFFRQPGSSDSPEWILVTAGQMIFTPPMLEHAVEFLEDSVFLNITKESREQSDYEKDIVKVDLHSPFNPSV